MQDMPQRPFTSGIGYIGTIFQDSAPRHQRYAFEAASFLYGVAVAALYEVPDVALTLAPEIFDRLLGSIDSSGLMRILPGLDEDRVDPNLSLS